MKYFFISIGVLCLLLSSLSSHTLGDAAAAMQPGEWRKITTTGYNFPSSRFAWSDYLAWDPTTEKAVFLGCTHYGPWAFARYDAGSNSWDAGPLPEACMVSGGSGCIGHGYDMGTMNTDSSVFYYVHTNHNVYRWDMRSSFLSADANSESAPQPRHGLPGIMP